MRGFTRRPWVARETQVRTEPLPTLRVVDDCQKALEEFKRRSVEVLESGKYDEDEHYYLDTESVFGFVYEIGNNGKIRPPERLLG